MKFSTLWALLLACPFLALTQNPGNVGTTNLTGWFKPDALPLGNTTAWSTTFPTGAGQITVTDASAPYPIATNLPLGDVANYNTTLAFENNSLTSLKAFENTAGINLLQNNANGAQGTFFCAYYKPTAGTNNHMLLWNNGAHAIQFRNLGGSGRLAIGISASNSANASRDWTEDFIPTIISYKGNRSTATSMSAYERGVGLNPTIASQSSGPTGLYMGVFPGNANSAYNGYLHEYIFYNRDLTALEMSKVHTYLAVKYGITLDITGGGTQGDYTATNGTLIWDASVNPSYHNGVIGIGREDSESLLQKQSHEFNDRYRIYVSTLATTNVGNSGVIANDISYVMMGTNQSTGCGTLAANNESPAYIQSRIAKEWKLTKTNFGQPFSIDLKIDTCTLAGTSVGVVDPNNLRLLVDTDGNFVDAAVFGPSATLQFSYNNGWITVSGISDLEFSNNTTRYLTVGYNTVEANFSGNNVICEGDTSYLTLNIQYANGPANITYSDGTNNYTLTGAIDGDILPFSPNSTTTYTVLGTVNFMDCCGSANNNSFQLTVNQRPTVSANASSTTICAGDSTRLTGGGATNYSWDNGVIDGDSISPATSTLYTVIGSDANGCSDTASIQIVVNNNPIVTANADTNEICIGDSIFLYGSGAQNYLWDNGAANGSFTSPLVSTLYRVIGTNSANCFDTSSIFITVHDLPNVVANASQLSLCEGDSVVLFGSGANTYVWDNGITDAQYFSPINNATYQVIGTDNYNCSNTDQVYVEVFPIVPFYLGPDDTICPQNPVTLYPNQSFSAYDWSTGSNAYSISVNYEGLFGLTVTDANGCQYSDSLRIYLSNDCYPVLFVPNAFTPNGDEHNNTFRTTGSFVYSFEIHIYNRWGQLLFESYDIDSYWDGTYNGKVCPEDSYIYTIKYYLTGNEADPYVKQGAVKLLR